METSAALSTVGLGSDCRLEKVTEADQWKLPGRGGEGKGGVGVKGVGG